ncbi:hypothetical protein ACT5YT_06625 [Leuconostoc suionicum]|uniref:hypothetical protein n=1 Tax=Leuconostoc suionicum TaxID=1511761 RepID=UPI00403741E3
MIQPQSESLQVDLESGEKLVPKFAFVGNNGTDWTVLLPQKEKVSAKSTQADNSSNNTQKESKR